MTCLSESVIFSVTDDHVVFDIWEVSVKKEKKDFKTHLREEY